MSVAFLFPGQGAQQVGMLHQLPAHPTVASTLKEASVVLGQDVSLLDNEQALHSTVSVQLALLIAGVATARALTAEGARPAMVAGLSVGAFSAAVIAGSLDFPPALRLVHLRGVLMERAYPRGYGMGVIVGLTEAEVNRLLKPIHTSATPVFLANLNAPRQIVIAGTEQAVQKALEQTLHAGAHKAERLPVQVPSHCPLMEPVTERLEQEIQSVSLAPPSVLYISSSSARALSAPEVIGKDLARNVAQLVRWYDATTALFELGTRLFVELPPGRVLTDLATEAFPKARAIALSSSSLNSVSTLIQRER
ncbi:MAG TPA: malonate decarboxylase subunit epsilon [Ktedonobacteraceae bacterium]|jgi:malonate decarboxylase epsilon subunit|nr:malonate decarboxylase subunit epsilon [Ktedonobacteraceae bacterium]